MTREEILEAAIRRHNLWYGTNHCDPKYIKACRELPSFIMQIGRELREK